MCPKVNWFVDYKFIVWFKFIIFLTGASLLALAKSINYVFVNQSSLNSFFFTFPEDDQLSQATTKDGLLRESRLYKYRYYMYT